MNADSSYADLETYYDGQYAGGNYYCTPRDRFAWAGQVTVARGEMLARLLSAHRPDLMGRVLEIGSGAQCISDLIPEIPANVVIATDISRRGLRISKARNPSLQCVCCLAEAPPMKERFRMIFAIEVIEHLKDPAKALRSWADMLVPGGLLLLTTPNGTFAQKTAEHISLLSREALGRLLKDAGLRVVEEHGIDLASPLLRLENRLGRVLSRFPRLSQVAFRVWMWAPFDNPSLAQGLIVVAEKARQSM